MRTNALDGVHAAVDEPMQIIHKEQDTIAAFCINQVRRVILYSVNIYFRNHPSARSALCWVRARLDVVNFYFEMLKSMKIGKEFFKGRGC